MSITRLRLASDQDGPAIIALWQECFGDESASIDFFFATWPMEEVCLVLERQGKIESMLMGLPTALCLPNGALRHGIYIYALCTDPEARGRGNAGALLFHAQVFFRERGKEFFLLTPEEPRLISYFRKERFIPAMPLWEVEFGAPDSLSQMVLKQGHDPYVSGVRLLETTEDMYQKTREAHLQGQMHTFCDLRDLTYQMALSKSSGAGLYLLESPWGTGCVATEYGGETLMVKELLVPEDALLPGLKLLQAALPAKAYRVRLPGTGHLPAPGRQLDFSLFRPLVPDGGEDLISLFPGHPGFAFD